MFITSYPTGRYEFPSMSYIQNTYHYQNGNGKQFFFQLMILTRDPKSYQITNEFIVITKTIHVKEHYFINLFSNKIYETKKCGPGDRTQCY